MQISLTIGTATNVERRIRTAFKDEKNITGKRMRRLMKQARKAEREMA